MSGVANMGHGNDIVEDTGKFAGIVYQLALRVLEGELDLKSFYRLWPLEASAQPFFQQVFFDLEDLVEHFPGGDDQTWWKYRPYVFVYLDCQLLALNRSQQELLRCREFILRNVKRLSRKIIGDQVRDFFAKGRG